MLEDKDELLEVNEAQVPDEGITATEAPARPKPEICGEGNVRKNVTNRECTRRRKITVNAVEMPGSTTRGVIEVGAATTSCDCPAAATKLPWPPN